MNVVLSLLCCNNGLCSSFGFLAAVESRSRGFCHAVYSFGTAIAAMQRAAILCPGVPGCQDLLSTLPSCGDTTSGWAGEAFCLQAEHASGVDFLWSRWLHETEWWTCGRGRSPGNSMTHAAHDWDRVNEILRKSHFLVPTHDSLKYLFVWFVRSHIYFYKKFLLTSFHSSPN